VIDEGVMGGGRQVDGIAGQGRFCFNDGNQQTPLGQQADWSAEMAVGRR
jgi:hypothetical protein